MFKERSKTRTQIRHFLLSHPKLNPFEYKSFYRAIPGLLKKFPDFMVVGQMKCGTSTLFHYLKMHPEINPPKLKEVKYFDFQPFHSKFWYKGHMGNWKWGGGKDKQFKTFDNSPTYFSVPRCAQTIHHLLPNIKIIIILRNPVDRAYSHYQMRVRKKQENLTFEEAIKEESKRIEQFKQQLSLRESSLYHAFYYPYIRFGKYIEDVNRWYEIFPNENLLIINSGDFSKNPVSEYEKVCNFLGISKPNQEIIDYINNPKSRKNVGYYEPMKENTRNELTEFFKPYNKQLSKFLNRDFNWD